MVLFRFIISLRCAKWKVNKKDGSDYYARPKTEKVQLKYFIFLDSRLRNLKVICDGNDSGINALLL
jgi:hypothetical protein